MTTATTSRKVRDPMTPIRDALVRIESQQAAMGERHVQHEERDEAAFSRIDAAVINLRLDLMSAINNGLHSVNQTLAQAMIDIDAFKQDKIRADERAKTLKEVAETERETRAIETAADEKKSRWRVPIIAAMAASIVGEGMVLGGGWFMERQHAHAHETRVTTSTTTTAEHPAPK